MSSLHQTRPAYRASFGNRPLRLGMALWLLAAAMALLPLPASATIDPDCVISVSPDGNVLAPPNATVPFTVSVAEGPGPDNCSGALYSLTVLNDTSAGMQIQTTGFVPVTSGSGSVGTTQNYIVNFPNANGPGTATIRAECTNGCVIGGSADEFTVSTEVIDLEFTAPAPAGQVNGTINTDLPVPIRLTKDGTPIAGVSLQFELISGIGGGFGMGMASFDSAATDSNGVASVNFRAAQEGNFTAQITVTDCDLLGPSASAGAAKGCTTYDTANIAITVAINRTLTISSGNNTAGQNGEMATLVVQALDDGAPASTSIEWTLLEGTGRVTLGAAEPGVSPGLYQLPVTFATNTGLIRIEARRLDLVNAPVEFTLENFAYQLERLNPSDGNNSGPTNSDIGYQVRLNRIGIATTGVAGNTINWSQSGPGTGTFLTQGGGPPSTSSVTDGAGVAAIDFRTATSGNYSIQASSAAPAAAGPVSFSTTVFSQDLSNDSQPAGPNYTDETTGGVSVIASDTVSPNTTPASGVPVTFTITGGQATFVGGATSAGPVSTDSAGRAASPGIVVGRGIANITIQASAPGRPTVNFSIPVTASSYTLSSTNTSFNVLTMDNLSLPVNLQRQGSSTPVPLSGANVSWQVSPPTGANLNSPTTTTGSTGDAPNNFVATNAGTYTVTATFDPGFSPPGPSSVVFTVNVAPQSRDILIISGDNQSAAAGSSYAAPLVVQTRENGTPVGNVPLLVSVNNPGDISVSPSSGSSDSTGNFQVNASLSSVAAFDRPLTVTITRSDDPTVSATFALQVDPPPAPSRRELVKGDVSGDGQRGEPGQMLALPLRVVALDDGRPVEGTAVRWVTSEGVTLMTPDGAQQGADVSGLTGSFGIATVNVTLPASSENSRGEFMITASRPGTSASTSFVVRYSSSDDGLSLRIVSGDNQTGLPGQTLGEDFVVAVTRGEQPVSGVVVTFAVSPADGGLSATRVTTDQQGRAATRLSFGAAAAYQVSASIDGQRSVTFNASGPNNRLIIKNGNRQGGVLGSRLDLPLEVELLTVDGTPIPQAIIQWLVENNGDATLGGTGTRFATSLTNDRGVAAISVELGTTTADSNLRISAGTSTVPQPVFFIASSRLPGVGPSAGNNQTGPINTTLPNPLELQITEGLAGKSLLGVPVRWTIDLGGGSLGSATTTTNAQGKTSNTWTLGGLVGTQRVVATLPGGVTVEFSATATADVAQSRIVRVSGDGQSLVTGTASASLVVEVRNSANAPQLDVPIAWSVENVDGTPSTRAAFENNVTRTVTAAGGQTRNVVVFDSPGAVVIRARFDGPTANTESVTFRLQAGISPIPTLSPVARDVGEAFDNFCDDVLAATNPNAGTADLAGVCTVLNDNADPNPSGVGEALEQLQNDIAPTLGTSGIDAINTQFDNLDIRLHMIRGEQFGGRQNQFNIGLWTPDGVLPLSFLPSMVVAAGDDETGNEEVGADFGRWGFFATGQIGRGEADAGSRSPQFDFDIAGLTVGADYRFSDRLVAGIALGYSDNDAELGDGRGKLDSKGWNIAGYATWYNEQAWFFDATAVYGQIDYDLRRRIFFSLANRDGGVTTIDQVASASTDGDALGASFSVGRDWQKGPWNLTGYLKGNYSKVDTDAYTESLIAGRPGEGLGLIIEGRSTTSMTSIFGGRATYILSRDWGILMPTATLEWEHEFEDDPNRVIARFAFDPTATRIVRDGDDVDSNYFNVGIGVSALFPGGRSAYVYYEELVGASRLSQGLLSLGLRFEF
jgi:uncharacterized protein with beta-barrel porin domain